MHEWVAVARIFILLSVPLASHAETQRPVIQQTVPEQVEAAYRYGGLPELERLYAVYGKPGLRSELTGSPRIGHFWMGVKAITSSSQNLPDDFYLNLDALTQKWANDNPQSILAQLLYAKALEAHAWAKRGGGYANTVSPEGWEGFRKYLGLAVTHLKRTEVLASQDSSWNVLMLDLGRALSWDRAELQGIYDSGVTKNPDNDALHSAMLTALLPKWGGDLNSVDEFVKSAVSRLPKEKGLIVYARLYALVSDIELKSALFTNSRVSWQTMKAGFDEMVARYPHFDNRNMYANFACMARDRETLKEQLALIGNDYVKKFWGNGNAQVFEDCKRFAQGS
jgi:hypothetical protein